MSLLRTLKPLRWTWLDVKCREMDPDRWNRRILHLNSRTLHSHAFIPLHTTTYHSSPILRTPQTSEGRPMTRRVAETPRRPSASRTSPSKSRASQCVCFLPVSRWRPTPAVFGLFFRASPVILSWGGCVPVATMKSIHWSSVENEDKWLPCVQCMVGQNLFPARFEAHSSNPWWACGSKDQDQNKGLEWVLLFRGDCSPNQGNLAN